MMLVSVVMPVFKALATVERSVLSVLNQTYSHLELIAVLDGPDPAVRSILEEISSRDARLRLVCSSKNRGTIRSRNIGVRLACGGVVAFCDSDDYWLSEKLSVQLEVMMRNQTDLVCSGYYYQKFGRASRVHALLPKTIGIGVMRYSNFIALSTAMYSVTNLGKCYFSEQSEGLIHEDYDLWMNLLYTRNARLSFLSAPMAVILLMPRSRSSNKLLALHSHRAVLIKYVAPQKIELFVLIAAYTVFGVVKRIRLYKPFAL